MLLKGAPGQQDQYGTNDGMTQVHFLKLHNFEDRA